MSLDAVKAEATEAETQTIEWRGHKLTIPATPDDLPFEWLLAAEDGKSAHMARITIGEAVMDRLARVEKMTLRDFNELADAIARAYGFADSGE